MPLCSSSFRAYALWQSVIARLPCFTSMPR
uniref:Uncharacterized protein n=1 Tax=Arundo donax TaxID=35708 RepID=A0A0A9VHI9_ARUDO